MLSQVAVAAMNGMQRARSSSLAAAAEATERAGSFWPAFRRHGGGAVAATAAEWVWREGPAGRRSAS